MGDDNNTIVWEQISDDINELTDTELLYFGDRYGLYKVVGCDDDGLLCLAEGKTLEDLREWLIDYRFHNYDDYYESVNYEE